MTFEIVSIRQEHARRFGELNREWLEAHNLMDESEEEQLTDPLRYFGERDGQVFVALDGEQVVGTCAVIPHGAEECELAKLTVASAFRGQGIARALVQRSIVCARDRGARRLSLVSNRQLQSALKLYESLGFYYRPVPEGTPYVSADVSMALDLAPTARRPDEIVNTEIG